MSRVAIGAVEVSSLRWLEYFRSSQLPSAAVRISTVRIQSRARFELFALLTADLGG